MPKKEPKISVIITAYNEEKHIKECVYSILNQSFERWELIIIDDGSTDNTPQIVRPIARNNNSIRYFSVKHIGRAKALNLGLRKSNGEYIAIQDADDVSTRKRLELQVNFLESSRYSIVGGAIEVKRGKEIEPSDWMPARRNLRIRSLLGIPFAHTSIMFEKEVYETVGGYRERGFRDYDFTIRVLEKYRGKNLDNKLVVLRAKNSSTSRSFKLSKKLRRTWLNRYDAARKLFPRYMRPVLYPLVVLISAYKAIAYIRDRQINRWGDSYEDD